jgi:hypothetical protein
MTIIMTSGVKSIIAAAIMYHLTTQPLELVHLAAQLEVLAPESAPSTALPPRDLKSWFDAHAYLKYDNEEEMKLRSTPERLKAGSSRSRQINLPQFITALTETTDLQFQQLSQSSAQKIDKDAILNLNQLYIQKLIIPGGSRIYFFGDLHGDISSLVICLSFLYKGNVIDETCKVLDKNGSPNFIFFGGDFTDRGQFGAEVLYTLCRLKSINPTRVFLIRGNHEEIDVNNKYGFTGTKEKPSQSECLSKFNLKAESAAFKDLKSTLYRFYTSLPAAIFLGVRNQADTNYLLLCHGGLELYDPTALFTQKTSALVDSKHDIQLASTLLKLDRQKFIRDLSLKPPQIYDQKEKKEQNIERYIKDIRLPCGFMWSDFNAGWENIDLTSLKYFYQFLQRSLFTSGRGFMVGSTLGNAILDTMTKSTPQHHMIGVLRAHQHNKTMPQLLSKNVGKLSDDNHSLYKIPLRSGSKYHIFTKVSTAAYAPSPSFMSVTMPLNPSKWELINFYINNFQSHVGHKEVGTEAFRKDLYNHGQNYWKINRQPLMTWQNAFDGSSKNLIEEQKKLHKENVT